LTHATAQRRNVRAKHNVFSAGSQAPAWEPLVLQALAWQFLGKLELQRTHSQAGAWERANTI